MKEKTERRLTCKRCLYEWVPRVDGKPRTCPRCKSPRWDEERRVAK